MQRTHRRARLQHGQWSLVGLLVSLAIIMILSAWYYAKILKPQAGSHNGRPASEQKAYGAVCSEYQTQLNQAVALYKTDHDDHPPQSFEALKKYGAGDEIVKAEGCQFQLDAATGNVTDIGRGQAARNAPPVVINSSTSPASSAPAPGPYWQTAPPPSAPGGPPAPSGPAAPTIGPGGVHLPPSADGSVPADGGGGE